MIQRIQTSDAARRWKLWMKLAVIAVVMTVITLRPKVVWWAAKRANVKAIRNATI